MSTFDFIQLWRKRDIEIVGMNWIRHITHYIVSEMRMKLSRREREHRKAI